MKTFNILPFALTSCAAVVMLAACGGSQAPVDSGAIPGTSAIATHAERDKSWMLPEAKSEELLYLSAAFYNNVYVFALPTGKLVGSIVGLNRPSGVCVDRNGDVFVANTLGNDILEYAHGIGEPIATLNAPAGSPFSCSVDSSSGDLAVSDFYNDVSVYKGAKGSPTTYSDYAMTYIYYVAYDGAGNLFVDGLYGNGYFRMAELPRVSHLFNTITLSKPVRSPGSIQWDGEHVAFTNGATNEIYHVEVAGAKGTVVRTTFLGPGKCFRGLGPDWIQYQTVIAPSRIHCGHVGVWKYPRGGPAFINFEGVHETFSGVTVSPAK